MKGLTWGRRAALVLLTGLVALWPTMAGAQTSTTWTTVAADDFNRAQGPLGVTPTGALPWVAEAGTWSVSSTQSAHQSQDCSLGACSATWRMAWVASGHSDVAVSSLVGCVANLHCGIVFRGASLTQWYGIFRESTTSTLRYFENGSTTPTGASYVCAPGNRIRLEAIGTQLTIKCGAATVGTRTVPAASFTRQGFGLLPFASTAAITSAWFEDFELQAPDGGPCSWEYGGIAEPSPAVCPAYTPKESVAVSGGTVNVGGGTLTAIADPVTFNGEMAMGDVHVDSWLDDDTTLGVVMVLGLAGGAMFAGLLTPPEKWVR